MITVSWYAELALRSRVSMSATGSVIVMAWWPSSPRFPGRDLRRGRWARGCAQVDLSPGARAPGCYRRQLPAGLRDAGQLAAMRQLPEADPAQDEPEMGLRPGGSVAGCSRTRMLSPATTSWTS